MIRFARAILVPFWFSVALLGCSDDERLTPAAGGASGASTTGAGGATGGTAAAGGASGAGGTSLPDGGDAASPDASEPEERRPQDDRVFTVDEASLAFAPLAGTSVETDRVFGVLDGAGYRMEIPKNWNGMLVMYAHGYAGTGAALNVTIPSIRQYLLENGYAWAASSYSKNYYDVRAGVEDTNALARAFATIASQKSGRTLAEPTKTYIIGHSMGGHITGAAIEEEAYDTAKNKFRYQGAVPMCGVMGDTELFDYFAAYQLVAQHLAGYPATSWPVPDYESHRAAIQDAFFVTFPTVTTPLGDKLKPAIASLTGGMRPVFEQGFASSVQSPVWQVFGGDGTVNGILTKNVNDTRDVVYQLDGDPAVSAEERGLNDAIYRASADPDANRLRRDGLRWVPKVSGKFGIPVVALHTLGDLYVPFVNQQIYRQRARAAGSEQWLVQRAIRGTGHCEFTTAEQVAAFRAMIDWEQKGTKPDGDEVLDLTVVAGSTYGCKFTDNTFTDAEKASMLPTTRAALPACPVSRSQ
jgi:pimeloyl-ACP methyl ester carboxylesterase